MTQTTSKKNTKTQTKQKTVKGKKQSTKSGAKQSVKRSAKQSQKQSVKQNKKRISWLWGLFVPVLAFQAAMGFSLMNNVRKLNILQNWQYAIIVVVLAIIMALSIYGVLFCKKIRKLVKVLIILLVFLIGVGYCYGAHYVSRVISFMKDMTGEYVETETYSVYVMKNGGYRDLNALRRQSVGYISINPHRDETETQLQNVIYHKAANYENIGEIVSALYDSKVAAIVLNDSYLDMLADTDLDFENKTTSLYNFEVRSETPDEPVVTNINEESFIMYISGTDSRSGLNAVARSDVNMLAVVNPKARRILLVSVPRDYYVQLHGTTGTKDKLTHAGVYGVNMSRDTMADLFDIEIAYTTKVSFGTVISVVDTLGGIEIDSDQEFTAWTNKSCHIKEGKQILDSNCALAYARERYSYASGDRHRIQNQQDVVMAILEKLSDPHYLAKYPAILKNAEGSFDTTMSYEEITGFAKNQLSSLKGWEVERIQVDGSGAMLPTYSMGAQKLYVMIPDQATVDAAKAKINEVMNAE